MISRYVKILERLAVYGYLSESDISIYAEKSVFSMLRNHGLLDYHAGDEEFIATEKGNALFRTITENLRKEMPCG